LGSELIIDGDQVDIKHNSGAEIKMTKTNTEVSRAGSKISIDVIGNISIDLGLLKTLTINGTNFAVGGVPLSTGPFCNRPICAVDGKPHQANSVTRVL
jgi:hypothetical protein